MKTKSLLKLILSVTVFVITAFLVALTANADAPYDGKPYENSDGAMIYVDETDCTAFIVNGPIWKQAYYDTSFDFDNAALAMRTAMYNREPSIEMIIGFKKNLLDMEKYSGDNNFYYFDEILMNHLVSAVYRDDGNPYGGDYLRQTSKITRSHYPNELLASRENTQYCFLKVTYYFSYITTFEQEQTVQDFVDSWNYYYIESNPVISACTNMRDKQYYTVKTIYNFITKNTLYDNEVYLDIDHVEYPTDSARYLASHSAYGAIFGNMEGALEDDFDPSQYEVQRVTYNTQGLSRVRYRDRGKAVCEGYSLLFYYMCKSNGIDCKIVTGDYNQQLSGKGSDPHAWNMVYLQDSIETSPEWYSVDATFASKRTQKISDYYTVVDYSFFLRGTENESFSPQNHQQSYIDYSNLPLSPNDFRFEVGDVYEEVGEENYIAIISRRRTDDPDEKYVEGENYNLENYVIIKPDGSCFQLLKIESDEQGIEHEEIVQNKGFTFYSTGYYYTCEFIDFAEGIEYTTEVQHLLDAGNYYFNLTTVLSNNVYRMNFTIEPLNMGELSKNYDLRATTINGENLSELDIENHNLKLQPEFTGTTINFDESNINIVDSAGAVLNSVNEDYKIYFGTFDGTTFTIRTVHEPGLYYLRIQYSGNYIGSVNIPVEVKKADLARYYIKVDLHFGNQINVAGRTFKFGNEAENDYVVIKEGVDFVFSEVTPYENVGDTGTFVLVALASSNYFEAGTRALCDFFVSTPIDLSAAYTGYSIPDKTYTGNAIEPAVPNPKIGGSEVKLVKGKDYTVTYRNNVNIGTATMIVQFKGNYTGGFTKTFKIVEAQQGGGGGESGAPSLGWNKRDGYWIYIKSYDPETKVATLLTGLLVENGKTYYLDPTNQGRMATGWKQIAGKWRYFDSDGVMQTGWHTIGKNRYYFSTNGIMVTGWQKISNKWYYFNSSGVMQKSWQKLSGKWYFFNSSGVMLTGWQKLSGKWYYFNSGGDMVTGWKKLSGKWYYFNSGGDMRTAALKTKTKTYKFNSSGVCLNP